MKQLTSALLLSSFLSFNLSLAVQAQSGSNSAFKNENIEADIEATLDNTLDEASEETETESEDLVEFEVDKPADNKPAADTQRTQIGARNISAFTRNLLGNTTVGGYFDTEYIFPDNGNSFFDQHRLILQVSAFMHERLFFNTEIEFEHGAVIGSGTNDGELKIEQAYLDYKIEDWLIFRSGALIIPVGRLNVLHDSDFRDTTARPLFTQVIVPTTWTEPGLGFYGTIYPDDMWELTYEAYLVQGLRDQFEDGFGLRRARNSLGGDNNNAKAFTTRLGLSPYIGLDFGLGFYGGAFDDAGNKNMGLFVGDFNWSLGPFELLGEGGVALFDSATQRDLDGNTSDLLGPMWGYYVEAHYHLFPEFLEQTFLANQFERPVFTLFGRISQVDTDASQLNVNDRTRLTLGLNYRPTTNTVFKLEYQWNIENEAIIRGDASKEFANNQILASVAAGF